MKDRAAILSTMVAVAMLGTMSNVPRTQLINNSYESKNRCKHYRGWQPKKKRNQKGRK